MFVSAVPAATGLSMFRPIKAPTSASLVISKFKCFALIKGLSKPLE